MKIELVRDEVEVAEAKGLLMDERHMVLPDGEWIRAVRRWTGRDNLFMYFHRGTEKFVIAAWLWPPNQKTKRGCIELEAFDENPDRSGAHGQAWCRVAFRDPEEIRQDIAGSIRAAKYKKAQGKAASIEERDDTVKHLRRKGMDDVARSLQTGPYVGEVEGGESLKEMKDTLTKAAKHAR